MPRYLISLVDVRTTSLMPTGKVRLFFFCLKIMAIESCGMPAVKGLVTGPSLVSYSSSVRSAPTALHRSRHGLIGWMV